MAKTAWAIFISARPHQWLKNLSLLTGLIFTGWLFVPSKFLTTLAAVGIFSLLTAAVYIFNDIIDAPADRLHPLKRKRPIASGELSIPVALFASIALASLSLILAHWISPFFFLIELGYIGLHIAYSLKLKQYSIIDVVAIATGFVLRVYAGAVAINAHINVWLLLCVISFSLFLAIGKRRSERTLLKGQERSQHRQALSHYPDELLNIYTSMFANTTWLTYALFTFQQPTYINRGQVLTLMSFLPKAFINQKLLMITVPVVIYGIMRYLQLIYDQDKGDSPAEVLLNDKVLLFIVALWGILVIAVIYGIG